MAGSLARQHLHALAVEIGRREPGSEGESRAADYICGVFKAAGYAPLLQPFSFYDEEEGVMVYSANVLAAKPGASEHILVVGAHYDSAYENGSLGADDNASGVAVMLEAAQRLKDQMLPYTVVFAAFDAEEYDLNGSAFFVDKLTREDLEKIVGMVNLDSLIAGDKTYVYGNAGAGTMRDWLLQEAEQQDFALEGRTARDLNEEDGTRCECADYDAFERADIPFAFFEATNWDLDESAMVQVDPKYGKEGEIRHTRYDTVEYIDATFPGRIDHHLNLYTILLVNLLVNYK